MRFTAIHKNFFTTTGKPTCGEWFDTLIHNEHVVIERIVSCGHSSPAEGWYDQHQHEWVMVLQGEAMIEFRDDGESCLLRAGDFLHIPAHREHRVAWTEPDAFTIWLAVFYPS